MKLCYQVATPDVAIADSVTAYQGPLADSFRDLSDMGYDGVELMTLDPGALDWDDVASCAKANGLSVTLVCTGEVCGQLGITFTDPDEAVRRQAVERVCQIINFAGSLNANVNIGRVRGQYRPDIAKDVTDDMALEAFRAISDHAAPLGVRIALETVTIMQTNFINTLCEAREFIHRVKRNNFGLMMDVFHLNLEEKNIYSAIWNYRDYNIHVHLADNNRRYPGHCGLDFRSIIEAFHDSGYDGAFCTEIFQIPDQKGAATGAIEYLAPIFERVYGRKAR